MDEGREGGEGWNESLSILLLFGGGVPPPGILLPGIWLSVLQLILSGGGPASMTGTGISPQRTLRRLLSGAVCEVIRVLPSQTPKSSYFRNPYVR